MELRVIRVLHGARDIPDYLIETFLFTRNLKF